MKIEVSSQAKKFILSQNEKSQKRIKSKVKDLVNFIEENQKIPYQIMDIKLLKGAWYPKKRFRIGKIRIIFDIDLTNNIFFIEEIDNRGDIY